MSTVTVRFEWRSDTAARWASFNPTPLKAEPCFEEDTGLLKIGDGTTAFNSLDYFNAVGSFNGRIGAVTLSGADVTGALGYTPYPAANPAGYTTNTGTVTSVGGTGTVSGITLSGTVTGSGNLALGGTLSVATANIADGAVTLAKQADMATGSVVYRKTAGSGPPEVQTLATLKADLGVSGPTAYMVLQSAYTLTSTTSAQKLFNVGASGNGAITLATGVYVFDCFLQLSSMSATSGNGVFSLAGTATLARQFMHSIGFDNNTTSGLVNHSGAFILGSSAFVTSTVVVSTGTAMGVQIRGTIDVTATGTIIPSFALATAAAAVVAAGSYFQIERVGNTATAYGGSVD